MISLTHSGNNKDAETPIQANTSDSASQENVQGTDYTPVLENNGDTTPSALQVLTETQQYTVDNFENGSEQPLITTAHQTDNMANTGASPSAQASIIVQGLSDISAEELTAALGSGVAPVPSVGTLIVDLSVSASLYGLGLTNKPASVSQTGSVTTQGPVSTTEAERKANSEVDSHGTAIHGSGSSALEGYEYATGAYHGPLNQPQEGAATTQDPAKEPETEMDLIDLTEDQNGPNDLSGPGSVTQTGQPTEQGPAGATDARTAALVRLLQVHKESQVLNITDVLTGQELAGLEQIKELLKGLPGPEGEDGGSDNPSAKKDLEPGELTNSSEDDTEDESSRASDSESLNTDLEEPRKPIPPRLYSRVLAQKDSDVVLSGERVESSSDVEIKDVTSWSTRVDELEDEWRSCYPPTDPYLVPQAEEIGDHWYQGEDCADPYQITPKSSKAILPTADGSLALKHDVVLPSTPEDRQYYKDHELDRRVFYAKSKRGKDGELKPITAEEARECEAEQRQKPPEDEYWQGQVRWSLYQLGPMESVVNFVGQGYTGVMAVPYHVVAPMAWEYLYALSQAQESLLGRLKMASLYGIKVLHPSYTSATSCPEPVETLDTPEMKKAACSANVTDTDVPTRIRGTLSL